MSQHTPLALGMYVEPYGTIEAIGCLGGERYYWLIHPKTWVVSMMPACVIEPDEASR